MSTDDPLDKQPFSYQATRNGRVHVFHEGKLAKVLKHREAERLLTKIEHADPRQIQLALAKATGQFKFGNER